MNIGAGHGVRARHRGRIPGWVVRATPYTGSQVQRGPPVLRPHYVFSWAGHGDTAVTPRAGTTRYSGGGKQGLWGSHRTAGRPGGGGGAGSQPRALEELHRSLASDLGGCQARGSRSPGWAVSPTLGRVWGAQLCTQPSLSVIQGGPVYSDVAGWDDCYEAC